MSTTTKPLPSTVDTHLDPASQILTGVRKCLAELDRRSVCDLTEDVELAEVIGQLKAFTAILLSLAPTT